MFSKKKENFYIYGLCDPVTNEVMYVGQAADAKKRFGAHVSTAMSADKHIWIKGLIDSGSAPVLKILEEVPVESRRYHGNELLSKEELHFTEQKWIDELKPKFNRAKPKARFSHKEYRENFTDD